MPRFFLALALSGALVATAAAAPPWADQFFRAPKSPHPAVVRVVAPHEKGASLGSGALVAVGPSHGLVVTNWHVVRDASGLVYVFFPDGFQSPAQTLRVDREWDLAALAIWRPRAEPVPLAVQAPRPGDPLTIAGYGGGSYREATGRCTQYVAPANHRPFEMVELSASARQGDSGGPILNQRGELAGVLFGTGMGQTTGSYCGRVRAFLATVSDDFQRLAPAGMMAQRPPTEPAQPLRGAAPLTVAAPSPPLHAKARAEPGPGRFVEGPRSAAAPTAPPSIAQASVPAPQPPAVSIAGDVGFPPPEIPVDEPPPEVAMAPPDPPSPFAQARNFLAAIGLFAIFFHGLRLLGGRER